MNKSKSCSNFSRRTLSESEKMLLNKYKNIDNDKNNNNDLKITDYFAKRINYSIKEKLGAMLHSFGTFLSTGEIVAAFKKPNGFHNVAKALKYGMISEEFATDLLEKEHVVVVAGTAFGDSGEGFERISYAYSLDALKEAIKRIERHLRQL